MTVSGSSARFDLPAAVTVTVMGLHVGAIDAPPVVVFDFAPSVAVAAPKVNDWPAFPSPQAATSTVLPVATKQDSF